MNIKKIIKEEMEDFGFADDMPELHGVSFTVEDFNKIYTIVDRGFRFYVDVTWINDSGKIEDTPQKRSTVMKLFRDGTWKPIV